MRIAIITVGTVAVFVTLAGMRAFQPCTTNNDCGAMDFCVKEPGECADEGVCDARPEGCIDTVEPVCGCDAKTYVNACHAAQAGVNVDYEGLCEPDYCWTNRDCETSEYCHFESCTLETGTCTSKPARCPNKKEPVCGCDGESYENRCKAAQKGVSIDHVGKCE